MLWLWRFNQAENSTKSKKLSLGYLASWKIKRKKTIRMDSTKDQVHFRWMVLHPTQFCQVFVYPESQKAFQTSIQYDLFPKTSYGKIIKYYPVKEFSRPSVPVFPKQSGPVCVFLIKSKMKINSWWFLFCHLSSSTGKWTRFIFYDRSWEMKVKGQFWHISKEKAWQPV